MDTICTPLNRPFFQRLAGVAAALALILPTVDAAAQTSGEGYIAVVTADNTALRSGASKSYYHFATLNEGDLVRVTGSKFMWSKIEATGPAFTGLYGLIKRKKDDPAKVALGSGGMAMTLGKTNIYAPNAATKDPLSGVWKALASVPPDTQVRILDTVETDAEVFHKVALTPAASGWISSASLRRANAKEMSRWERILAGEITADEPVVTPPPAPKATPKPAMDAVPETAVVTIPPASTTTSTPEPVETPLVVIDTPEPSVVSDVEEYTPLVLRPQDDTIDTPTPAALVEETTAVTADTTTIALDDEPTTVTLSPGESVSIETSPRVVEATDIVVEGPAAVSIDAVPARHDAVEATIEVTPTETVTMGDTRPVANTTLAMDQPRVEPVDDPATVAVAWSPLNDEKVTLEQLEGAFARLQNEPIETAEVAPLRRLYTNFADRHREKLARKASYADARAEQLRLWGELQQQRQKIVKFREQVSVTAEDLTAFADRIAREGGYTAVGRLVASSIYDGKDLPYLLRVQDPASGRTVAYLQTKDSAVDLMTMVGQLVGVIGTKQYDAGLRIQLVQPTQVDHLSPDAVR